MWPALSTARFRERHWPLLLIDGYLGRMKPLARMRCEPSYAGVGAWSVSDPSSHTIEIQRGGNCHLLHMSSWSGRESDCVGGQPSHALGPRALNASALRIEPGTDSTLQIGPQASNGFLLWLPLELGGVRLIVCQGTASS